jgi:DNA mismatch repair protein MutL
MKQDKNNLIKILPDYIANQIAAGEVVQRPESVVKELIENSLDAGAKSIAIMVRGAGKQLIHIIDDGSGMSETDLRLSTKRHATSKVFTQQDLETIMSYGFRGEALASIASVANLEIRTKQEGDEFGWKLQSEPNKEEALEPNNCDVGSQIFVRNLFFNVPARRKFLKANLTEFRYISDTVIKFALSHPDIRITFYDDNNLIFDAKPNTQVERIRNVLGNSIAEQLMPVEYQTQYIKVTGFIGRPQIAKNSRTGQYLYLNNRSIQNKALSHAIFSAYEHLLEKSAHPVFVLNLEVDPANIDINVHPQKHEVKFDDERFVYNILRKAVQMSLQQHNIVPEIVFREEDSKDPFQKLKFSDQQTPSGFLYVNKETGEVLDDSLKSQPNFGHQAPRSFTPNTGGKSPNMPSQGMRQNLESRVDPREVSAFDALFDELNTGVEHNRESEEISDTHFWQLHLKYIMVQTPDGMTVIDQHNAHERILYERALKAMNKEFTNSQTLLFPITTKVNPSEKALIADIEQELRALGYSFVVDEEDAIIESVPLDVINGEESRSFADVICQFEEYDRIRQTDKRDNLAASFACKAAIKTGKKLSQPEMKKLFEDLFACETPYVCPHGRPVVIEFTLREFDSRFGRTS